MTLTQLEYFISVAELKSFTKAAERHSVTQTAITQQIRGLEEALGVQLVDRASRPIRLTVAGQTFLQDARGVLERMRYARTRVSAATTSVTGTMSLGYVKGYERSNLSKVMKKFHRIYPNIFISCYRREEKELQTGVKKGTYDLIFTWNTDSEDDTLDSTEVEKSGLSVVLYPSHPLANRSALLRENLKEEKLLCYMSDNGMPSDGSYQLLDTKSGDDPDIIFYSSDVESILMMVAAEEGISLIPTVLLKDVPNPEHLVFVPLRSEQEESSVKAVWRKENESFALKQFLLVMGKGILHFT